MALPSELRAEADCFPFGYRDLSDSVGKHRGDDLVRPVLIVGAGSVGVSWGVVEKNKTFSRHRQALFINNCSMEVFCKLDGLADEIERLQPPADLWRKFVYCTLLTGSVLETVDHLQPQDFEKVVSPVSVAHFSQYKLTRLLVEHAEKLDFQIRTMESLKDVTEGGVVRGREILMGHECVSVDTSSDNFVGVTVSSVEKGEYKQRDFRCKVLLGVDGAGSTVRKLTGIDLRGENDLQKLVNFHLFSRDLGDYPLNNRLGMLYFVFNTEAIGVSVAHDLEQKEFILQSPFYPPQQEIKDFIPMLIL